MKKINLLALAVIVMTNIYLNTSSIPEEITFEEEINSSQQKVTVYKSPSCGCCANYISLLEEDGYAVDVVETNNMASIKEEYGIPSNMESCHTSVFGDYVVEGHVPFAAIDKLLEEQPDIKGIALAGMPLGSPGMSGAKAGTFNVYSLSEHGSSVYWQE